MDQLKIDLYGNARSVPENFDRLNPSLKGSILPGQMIVLGDPDATECSLREEQLMAVAERVNREVVQLSEDEAQSLVENYDFFEFAAWTGSAGIGAGSVVIGRQLKAIETSLKNLEALYQSTYVKKGGLTSDAFFKQRQAIFREMDFSLGKVARKGLTLDNSPKIKNALGLSSKSIVHHWNKAGVGNIPGYSTHIDRVAAAAKWTKAGGLLALGLDASVSAASIHKACTLESDGSCKKTAYAEVGRFAGGAIGGAAGAGAAPLACVAIGLGTGGPLGVACLVVLGGAGSAATGYGVSNLFARVGEIVYEVFDGE